MKHLLIILAFAVSTFTVKAQQLSFDEAVLYIKERLDKKEGSYGTSTYSTTSESYTTRQIDRIDVNKAGEIEIIGSYFRKVTDPPDIKFSLNKTLKIESKADKILLFVTDETFYLLKVETQVDAERIAKAFNHLKSLLPKEKDPFDN